MAAGGAPPDDAADESAAELSPALARLWYPAAPGRRGPKPALTLEKIAAAAASVADREGLAAVSMARVAEALGYSTMALYRYVSGKDELLLVLADQLATDPPDLAGYQAWRGALERWTVSQIELILDRPWFLDLPLASTLPGPRRTKWIDVGIGALDGLDIDVETKFRVIGLLAQHVLGEARVQVENRRAAVDIVRRQSGMAADTPQELLDPAALAAANPYGSLEVVLARHADAATYPALFKAFRAGGSMPLPMPPASWRDDAMVGLGVLLDGIEVLINRRSKR